MDSSPQTPAATGARGDRQDSCGCFDQGRATDRRRVVCDGPVTRPRRVWISLRVATDVLPLLVNACSVACVAALPAPPKGYVRGPHSGGPAVRQPTADYW
ncbi:hypothetical protein GCM10010495_44190 [Kitasatospora herbaricolor]|uniref:hypothetical protein n=1 Tax=Kitasatospora herbaricolor TaxID=68217 RepID=UPI00174A99E5|nr:hypothetical protein [Kitasatospora herbaricolor]MDQ0306038.1 hypothetical protein [Kitasatospora herbaricolor]GGV23742.1 hypothetical protein GCM10010495_44190 [Kitasatospora herbaricolor]